MASTPLIIAKVERRGVILAKAFISKKLYTFDWDKDLPDADQYSRIAELTISALSEESPNHNISIGTGPANLPDSFDYGGVLYLINVERK